MNATLWQTKSVTLEKIVYDFDILSLVPQARQAHVHDQMVVIQHDLNLLGSDANALPGQPAGPLPRRVLGMADDLYQQRDDGFDRGQVGLGLTPKTFLLSLLLLFLLRSGLQWKRDEMVLDCFSCEPFLIH